MTDDRPAAPDRETDQILIFDTTLRDGEQSPGATMSLPDKLRIARQLEELNVDIIEAGFPIASPGDFEAVRAIAREIRGPRICGLARAADADIDRAWEAVREARHPRIHTFIATSPIHMQHKLQLAPAEVLARIDRSVRRARQLCDDVQWSPEDATRSDPAFLSTAVATAVRAGAGTINIPDTVGYTVPGESAAIIRRLRDTVPELDRVVLSTHCHNDLGLAVANALAAVEAGARQVECTINGLGERAGNAALEEVVMALRVRGDALPFHTGIRSNRLAGLSRLVSSVTGFPVQFNKAIIGKNAFAHEAGIHQDGVLKHAGTYEIMQPHDVGLAENNLVFGKHSGRHALAARLAEFGIVLGDNLLQDVFARFKALADRKRVIYDDDILALVDDAEAGEGEQRIRLATLRVSCGTDTEKRAEVELEVDGERRSGTATGSGPVDATFRAIRQLSGREVRLDSYSVTSVTRGTDAQAEVSVRLAAGDHRATGHSADTDTVVSSARAFVHALNQLDIRARRSPPAPDAGLPDAAVQIE